MTAKNSEQFLIIRNKYFFPVNASYYPLSYIWVKLNKWLY